MKIVTLVILAAFATTTAATATIGVVTPPIPGSVSAADPDFGGRSAPQLQRVPPQPPPAVVSKLFSHTSPTLPPIPGTASSPGGPPDPSKDGVVVVVRRVTIRAGERVTVTAGPGALTPGEVLLDARNGAKAPPRRVTVVVLASRDGPDTPVVLVERS